MEVSHNIRRLRESLDLSQIEMAEHLDVSQSTISRWESGKQIPELKQVHCLAERAGKHWEDFLYDDFIPPPRGAA